ncbi:MAG: L-threonylcarbamoyladenylate synthase [Mycoplasmataceae bacterium]|nr:L-threonylcarbamoyladenylate synthase [Mycoplasmataceae bacterium]
MDSICFEINNGKVAVVETDTVMGIISKDSQLIYNIKKRSSRKKLIILVASIRDVPNLTDKQTQVIEKYWPGPLTVIKNNVGYRMPNHEELLELIGKTGPVFSSSANISGKTPIYNHREAEVIFNKWSNKMVLVEGKQLGGTASTVINIDRKKILREGPLNAKAILEQLGK